MGDKQQYASHPLSGAVIVLASCYVVSWVNEAAVGGSGRVAHVLTAQFANACCIIFVLFGDTAQDKPNSLEVLFQN